MAWAVVANAIARRKPTISVAVAALILCVVSTVSPFAPNRPLRFIGRSIGGAAKEAVKNGKAAV